MSQGFYTPSNIYTPQRLVADKFGKIDQLNIKVKPRESEPPLNTNDKKIYDISKFSK